MTQASSPTRGQRLSVAARRFASSDRAVMLTLFLTLVVVRWPLRSQFLVNWDAVNFALGIEAFDLTHHQPHPPGYIGYVLLGRVVTWLAGDPNAALTAISVVAGASLPVGAFLLGRRLMSRRWALVTAALVATSPVVWYYSVVALTYILSGALVTFIAWAAHVARTEHSARHLYLAAVLAGLLGSIRQTDLLFMVPLLIFAGLAVTWRERFRAVAVLGVVVAVWLIPLLVMAGGVAQYLELSRALAELAGGRTWILGLNPVGILQNLGLVAIGLLVGLNVALLGFVAAGVRRLKVWRRIQTDDRRLLLLWVIPAILVFLFIHTGQIGYVLLILPAFMMLAGVAGEAVAEARAARRSRLSLLNAPATGTAAFTAGALVVANAVGFFSYPVAARAIMDQDAPIGAEAAELIDDGGVNERTRQFSLELNDEYWERLTDLVQDHDPDTTVLLAAADSGGSFRHLAFYTPEHTVYAVGRDRNGTIGHLFTANAGTSDYSVEGLDHARTALTLPEDVETIVIVDRAVAWDVLGDAERQRDAVDEHLNATVYRVPAGAHLVFGTTEEEDGVITVVPRTHPDPVRAQRGAQPNGGTP